MGLGTTFRTRIEVYVGTTDDNDALDQFLHNAAIELIELAPIGVMTRYAEEAEVDDADGLAVTHRRMLTLHRDGFDAKEVPIGMKTQISDSDSLHYSSKRTPVFFQELDKVYMKPDPTSDEKMVAYFIPYPNMDVLNPDLTLDGADTSFSGGPEQFEEALVLNAAMKWTVHKYAEILAEIPAVFSAPSDFTFGTSPPSLGSSPYDAFATVVYDSTGAATELEKITSVTPVTVDVGTLTAPTYTAPSSAADFGDGNDFDDILTSEEDIEKASVELQKQNHMLGDYQADLQNAVNSYQEELAKYQAETSELVTNAQAQNAASVQNMQKDLQIAQAEAQIAESRALQFKVQETQEIIANNGNLLQKFQQALAEFQATMGKDLTIFTTNLQKDIQERSLNTERALKLLQASGAQMQTLQAMYTREIEKIKALL